MQFRKTVGKVNGLTSNGHEDRIPGSMGLGHTRWATHGRPSQANAHPHTDCSRRIAVVHNGIVEISWSSSEVCWPAAIDSPPRPTQK